MNVRDSKICWISFLQFLKTAIAPAPPASESAYIKCSTSYKIAAAAARAGDRSSEVIHQKLNDGD